MKFFFFLGTKTMQRDIERFGVFDLARIGVTAVFVESPFLWQDSYRSESTEQRVTVDYIVSLQTWYSFFRFLRARDSDDVLLFSGNMLDRLGPMCFFTRAHLVNFKLSPLPGLPEAGGGVSVNRFLKNIGKPAKLFSAIKNRFFKLLWEEWVSPDLEIYAGRSSNLVLKNKIRRKDCYAVRFWSLDTEKFLRCAQTSLTSTQGHFLFLDQNLTDGHDIRLFKNRVSRVDPLTYYQLLTEFFNQVNNIYGKDFKVLVHPKANPDIQASRYGLSVIDGNAVNAVRESEIVFAHDTTAISYAVLLRKPIVFISSETFSFTLLSNIDKMANLLGRPLVSLEDNFRAQQSEEWYNIDEIKYKRYEENFLISDPIGDVSKPLWEEIGYYIQHFVGGGVQSDIKKC